MKFWIDIEDISGNKYGPGPITSAVGWQNVRRLSKAGEFSFSMPASDERASLLQGKRIARCYAVLNGEVVEFGAGFIEGISLEINSDGISMLQIRGGDLLRELSYIMVPGSAATGITSILAYSVNRTSWSLNTTDFYNSTATSFYLNYDYDTILGSLQRVATVTGEHFRYDGPRELAWMRTDTPASGVRAVRGIDPIAVENDDNLCLITSLIILENNYDLISRIFPHYPGIAVAPFLDCTRTPASGYNFNIAYLYNTTNEADPDIGWIAIYQNYQDFDPTGLTAEETSNALYDRTFADLQKRDVAYYSYRLSVIGLKQIIQPGETIRVIYRDYVDGYEVVNLDEDLIVLEVSTIISDTGVNTTDFTVANIVRYPDDDAQALADMQKKVADLSYLTG